MPRQLPEHGMRCHVRALLTECVLPCQREAEEDMDSYQVHVLKYFLLLLTL